MKEEIYSFIWGLISIFCLFELGVGIHKNQVWTSLFAIVFLFFAVHSMSEFDKDAKKKKIEKEIDELSL